VVDRGYTELLRRPISRSSPRVQAKKVDAPGVLKLKLGSGFYRWKFVPVTGRHYTDSGRARCH
jgi:hypothetical protein